VAQARANVAIRRAQLGIARAGLWPRLALFTSYGVVDYPREIWPDSDWRTNWTAGVNLSLPLFTGFKTTADIASARADVRAAQALAAEAAQLAAVDERERASDVAVAEAASGASHRSTELARRAHQIAELRYRQGDLPRAGRRADPARSGADQRGDRGARSRGRARPGRAPACAAGARRGGSAEHGALARRDAAGGDARRGSGHRRPEPRRADRRARRISHPARTAMTATVPRPELPARPARSPATSRGPR
jgi:hypothetical protein